MDIKDVITKVRHLDVITSRKATEIFTGNYKSSFRGRGLEVSNLREYQDGDDARHIDWIATAKNGKPYVKEYQETRELTTMILVDLSASMNFTSVGKTKKEVVIETVALLIFSALKNGDKFGAIFFADEIELFIPPKKGHAHALRILRELIIRFEDNAYKKAHPDRALMLLNKLMKRSAICFFISDEVGERTTTQLQIANKRHDFIFINIFDPFERGITNSDFMEIEDPETGEQMIVDFADKEFQAEFHARRHEQLHRMKKNLQRYRIETVDISTDGNIFKELLLFFKKRQLKR